MADQKKTLVYVGTFANDPEEGIYIYELDPETGVLELVHKEGGIENPFFLAIDAEQKHLYSTNGVKEFEETPGGAVSAFAIDPETGGLTLLNQQSARGDMPCYVSIDRTGKCLLVGNYSSGNAALLPIQEDGMLAPASDVVQHEGSSVHPDRQTGPFVHSFVPAPDGRFAFAADLGIDKLMVYRVDAEQGKLEPNDPPFAKIQDGAGPRHLAFHPNGKFAYLINELDNTFVVFAYDAEKGGLEQLQVISTLPEGYGETSYCADVQILPSGKFLYGSNRGHDSIAIFAIDEGTGTLTFVGHESTQGNFPWNLAIDPTSSFLLVANQGEDCIVSFRIDGESGKLAPSGCKVELPKPVCMKMV